MTASRPLGLGLASALAALASPADAQQASPAPMALTVASGPTQQALAATAERDGIRLGVCPAAPCSAGPTAKLVPFPPDVELQRDRARASVITLRGGANLLRVDVPGKAEGSTWVLLASAPRTSEPADPVVLWQGIAGDGTGDVGEEHGAAVLVEGSANGPSRVLVGEHRADVNICGRPTLVAAREVDPRTLTLKGPALVQNLTAEERSHAIRLKAESLPPLASRGSVRLLRATAASSALGKRFATLTDGDPNTTWSEAKPGDGAGEFVTMSASDDVEITGFDVTVRGDEEVDEGVAPKRFYLATHDRLIEVTLPEDAWRKPPGTRYQVKLPAALRTTCVAVVLDEAFAAGKGAKARVTLAEVEAKTAFDGATLPALVKALAGGGSEARAAAALLARGGSGAFEATAQGYDGLDEPGKQLAARVLDSAACSVQAPFFGAMFARRAAAAPSATKGVEDAEIIHARDRLRQCGQGSAGVLGKLVLSGENDRVRRLAADELAAVAPGESIAVFLDAMASANDDTRKALRAALARAARHPRSLAAIAEEILPAKLKARGEILAVDLLRATGPSLGQVDGAEAAFSSIATPSAPFRTRYLLVEPAAYLASSGSQPATAWLRQAALRDEDFHVRARAVLAARHVKALAGDVITATYDPEVRVRETAVMALGELEVEEASGMSPQTAAAFSTALADRLIKDEWTFVRTAATRALAALPTSANVDSALAFSLDHDPAPDVRSGAIDALAARHATRYLPALRERQEDAGEAADVRVHGILALASLCDRSSVDLWTKLATGIRVPIDDGERRLQAAAITALGQVHPEGLAQRLGSLLQKETPAPVRELVKSAIASAPACAATGTAP